MRIADYTAVAMLAGVCMRSVGGQGTCTADWATGYPLHFPVAATFKVEPIHLKERFGLQTNLFILGKPVETLYDDAHAGKRPWLVSRFLSWRSGLER